MLFLFLWLWRGTLQKNNCSSTCFLTNQSRTSSMKWPFIRLNWFWNERVHRDQGRYPIWNEKSSALPCLMQMKRTKRETLPGPLLPHLRPWRGNPASHSAVHTGREGGGEGWRGQGEDSWRLHGSLEQIWRTNFCSFLHECSCLHPKMCFQSTALLQRCMSGSSVKSRTHLKVLFLVRGALKSFSISHFYGHDTAKRDQRLHSGYF